MNRITAKSNLPKLHDWEAKKALLRGIYNVTSDKSLVALIALGLHISNNAKRDFIESCYGTLRKWEDGSGPNGDNSLLFWEAISLNCKSKPTIAQLWICSIVEFAELFSSEPTITSAVNELILANGLLPDDRKWFDSRTKAELQGRYGSADELPKNIVDVNDYLVHVNTKAHFESPMAGLEHGRVQINQFFRLPETAKAWADLIDSKNYRMYYDCLVSLSMLVDSECWKTAVANGRYSASLTLGGGGSPEKDQVLSAGLLKYLSNDEQLIYTVNDISMDMIHESAKRLPRINDKLGQRVIFRYLLADFLLLGEQFKRPAEWRSTVWAILGGTIGNVSETKLFKSIGEHSEAGDLLVVGLDTIGNDTLTSFEGRMATQYCSKEVDALLLSPLHASERGRRSDSPLVKMSVEAGRTNSYSNVPNSWTVVCFTPPKNGRDRIILATSTRYVLSDFVDYANRLGWEHLGTTVPPESTFRQLLFRKNASTSAKVK